MKFKGSILITDPCYIIKKGEDWDNLIFGGESTPPDLSSLGMPESLMAHTGIGDGTWSVYQVDDPWKCLSLLKEGVPEEEIFVGATNIGSFGADAGMSCVVNLDQLLAYDRENTEEFLQKYSHCYTLIEGFDGDIVLERVPWTCGNFNFKLLKIIGTGNINFITT